MGGEFTNQEWDQALNGFDTHRHMALGFLRGGHSAGRGASSGFFVREWVHSNGRIHASGPRTPESGKALSAQRRCDWPRGVGENKKQILPIPRGKTTSENKKKERNRSFLFQGEIKKKKQTSEKLQGSFLSPGTLPLPSRCVMGGKVGTVFLRKPEVMRLLPVGQGLSPEAMGHAFRRSRRLRPHGFFLLGRPSGRGKQNPRLGRSALKGPPDGFRGRAGTNFTHPHLAS